MDAVVSCNISVLAVWSPSLQISDQIVKPVKGSFQTLAAQQLFLLKVHCVVKKKKKNRRERASLADFLIPNLKNTLALNKLNKPTDLKEQHNLYCFTYICGGPRHLSSFKQRSGNFVSLMEKFLRSV